MITGSCLCGGVRWQAETVLDDMTHCHCSMCRKAHGAPFGTYVTAPRSAFRWLSGAESISRYESSPGFLRAFCGVCGSVVPDGDGEERIFMPAGCLDDDLAIRPRSHIFATSKAPWFVIADGLPQHGGYEHPEDGPNIERPGPGPAPVGVLRGSCLCGDVAFEVGGAIQSVHNCHCSRCRKARAAAHTTNAFAAMDAVVFLRGEDRLKTYKLPDARYFTQVFCTRCGSGMPRLDRERGIAIVPLAALDDDPGRGSEDHIYTGSKASWYEIADDLPQFEERPE